MFPPLLSKTTPTYNPNLADADPVMYAATEAGNPTPADRIVTQQTQYLNNKHAQLLRMTDMSKAKNKFKNLDKNLQISLERLYPESDYMKPEKNIALQLLTEPLVETFISPFKSFFKGAVGALTVGIDTVYNVGKNTLSLNPMAAVEYVTTVQNYKDSWAGIPSWREESVQEIDEKYGVALGGLVRAQLEGKKPGDAIREFGINGGMAGISQAIIGMNDYNTYLWGQATGKGEDFPLTDAGAEYMTAVQFAQSKVNNFGNDFTNYMNTNHPPKNQGKLGMFLIQNIFMAQNLLGSITTQSEVKGSKDGSKWLVRNPNPFSKQKFVSTAGPSQFQYEFIGDPLSWVTLGGSKAVKTSAKLGEKFIAQGRAGVSAEIRIADLFANKRFYRAHEGLVGTINDLRVARASNKVDDAAVAMTKIQTNYAEYDNPFIIDHLLNTKVLGPKGTEVPVTDMDTLQRFFERGVMIDYITTGRTYNIGYYRENHVMIDRSTRLVTDGVRGLFEKVFNGLDRAAPNGVMSGTKLSERLKGIENAFNNASPVGVVPGDPVLKETVRTLLQQGSRFQKNWAKFAAKHPEGVMIQTANDKIDASLPAFRDFARVLTGDKLTANMLTEIYIGHNPDDRFNMLYSMYKFYMDRIGLPNTSHGLAEQRNILEEIFGMNGGFGPVAEVITPAHLVKEGAYKMPPGASQPLHLSKGIAMIDFERVHQALYDTRKTDVIKIISAFSYSDAARLVNSLWALLVLFPKVGIKGAVDEIATAGMTSSYGAIFNFLDGSGRAASNVWAAYTASPKATGMVKELFGVVSLPLPKNVKKAGLLKASFQGKRNPYQSITAEERLALIQDVEVVTTKTLPSGRVIDVKEWVSADEFWGNTAPERLADIAIARFGGKLTTKQKAVLKNELVLNSNSMNATTNSTIGAAFGNNKVEGGMIEEMFGKSVYSQALDAAHLKQTGRFEKVEMALLSKSSQTMAHYGYFWRYFANNTWSNKVNGTVVDFGSAFIKHDAMRTVNNGEAYVDDIMGQIGFQKDNIGNWMPKSSIDPKTGFATTTKAKKAIDSFIGEFRQASQMRAAGMNPGEIAEAIVRNARDELYTIFHGADDVFNENLLNMIKFKVEEGATKVATRNKNRSSLKTLTEKEIVAAAKYEAQLVDPAYNIRQVSYAEFEDVTQEFGMKAKEILSDIEWQEVGKTLGVKSGYEKWSRFPWEVVDRQINDIHRADAYFVKLFEQSEKLEPALNDYTKQLMKSNPEMSAADAAQQAQLVMHAQASSNAAADVMKYADNPAIRSQLAWGLRGVGRFNRATEDYFRRMYRYLKDNPEKAVYRAGHFGIAMDATGFVYTDQNGNDYVVLPNDGVLWRVVNPALNIMFNPLGTAKRAIQEGVESVYKQPEYNAFTLNLSMLNPSYSEGAGIPSLHGETMAISVLAIKKILGLSGQKKIAEEIDNIILGPVSDNTTALRAFVPSMLTNFWKLLGESNLKDVDAGMLATSIQQAAAYLQFSDDFRLEPQDATDVAKLEKYFDRLSISTYNIMAVKAGMNIVSPIPVGTTVDGVNPLLRDANVIGFKAEFNDILRAVLEVNAIEGYQLPDPVSAAVAMFVGSYPDKLIFTVSKNSKAAKTYINYTKDTKDWALDNPALIKRYNEIAFLFAPHVGEYDPYVVRFLEAAEIIPDASNPWVSAEGPQSSPLYRYIKELTAAVDRGRYYDLERKYNADISDPNNPMRNNVNYRQTLWAEVKAQQQELKNTNPMLKYTLETSRIQYVADMKSRFTALKQMINDPDFVSKEKKNVKGKLPYGQRDNVQLMVNITTNMLTVFEDENIRSLNDGGLTLQKVYEDGMKNLTKLAGANYASGQAYQKVIKPLLEEVYQIPTKGLSE